MKKAVNISILVAVILGLYINIYAGTNASAKHEFKSSDREVNFDIERGQGEVVLHLQSSAFGSLDQIIIERSSGDASGFTTIKSLDLADLKLSNDYYRTYDKFPLPAKGDSYYRIKTVSKDGSMKTFPPVQLAALSR